MTQHEVLTEKVCVKEKNVQCVRADVGTIARARSFIPRIETAALFRLQAEGYMCLHLACKNENPFSVSHLIQNGGNVNAIAEDGVQPIHLAILYPNEEIIKILLDNNAHIDALFKTHYYQNFSKLSEWVHSNDITLITHSIISGSINVVKLLLEYDVIPKTSFRFIKNIIFYASASNNLEIMVLILENLGKIFGKMSERFKSFVNNKYSQGCYSGYTPLHMACRNKNLSCVEFLIQNGADVFAEASDGAQPIHVALIVTKNEEIIKLLLEKGANVNAKFQLKFLKKYINNPTLLDFNSNFTLLNYAIFVRDTELFELLLDYEANVDIKNNLNKTLLMYAVENNLTIVVQLLLDNFGHGKNINARDNSGRTALNYVLDSKRMKNIRFSMRDLLFHYTEKGNIARMLLNAGANVFAMINNDPKTLIANRAAYKACPQVLNVVLINQLTSQRDISSPLSYADREVDYQNDFDNSYGHLKRDIVKAQIYTVTQHCLRYIIRRQGIGYEVANKDAVLMKLYLRIPSQRSLKRFIQETKATVRNTVNRLKAKFIAGTHLSYFDILDKNVQSLARYARKNEIVAELAADNYRNELRFYYAAFKYKWSQAFLRRRLLDKCDQRISEIVKLTLLPYDVMLVVFEYIENNEDLKNFMVAAVNPDD
ncbi:putative ankyrin repeat protein RF_0381 [Cotesia glomerata]|uniref:putative ankyrin repeat protein RF_0381 n=1 Tax=Cotesia glomerata TaxID=32391 RepID=UPI001D00F7DB|nr:putative ankyrin repeat protein RF_0381 [Cotesia glomerata]